MNSKAIAKTIISIIVILALLCTGIFALMYSEYLELLEIGENFIKVFTTNVSVHLITFAVTLLVCFVIIYSNFIFVRSNAMYIDTTVTMFGKIPVILIFSIVFSFAGAYVSSEKISSAFLPFINSEWFNLGDPIFHQDVGYYVFQRPFYITVINCLTMLTGFLIAVNCISYFLIYAGHDVHNIKNIIKEKGIVTHIIVSIVLFFLSKVLSYQFTADSIIFKQHDGLTGANYIDINVWLKFYRIAPVILLLSVVITIYFVLRSKINLAVLTVCIYPVAFILVSIMGGIVDTIVVRPNELAVSSEYIQNNINFTRAAYQLDDVAYSSFTIKNNLTADKILKNTDTVNNIKLNDYNHTLGYLNELHSEGDFYTFTDANTSIYDINGHPTVVSVAAREIDHSKINGGTQGYADTVYKYTHGIGAVMCTDNTVTSMGLPQPVIKDIPSRSNNGAPAITEPRIYYGMLNNDYCVVNTKDKEYDEIEKEGYDYNGNGGILLNMPARFIYSIKLGDSRLLLSDKLKTSSKLLINRNVLERVEAAAPFFTYDKDPYMIVDKGGRLKWVVDVYTTSEWFPYSQYTGTYNYIRNSAKAVVDAYGGTVEFYITDRTDPIIKCYQKIYPTLFEQEPFPADLISHTKYPMALFKIRANMYKAYHVTNAESFYKKSDVWSFAKERYGAQQLIDVEPSYSYIDLDGNGNKFMLTAPYTLANKDGINGWLTVDCSFGANGKTTFVDFSNNMNSYGTLQIEDRIDADVNVTQKLSMINLDKGNILRGNMVVVPIDNNILYIEPIYISAEGKNKGYARLEYIVAVYNDKIVCEDSLSECFKALFGINKNLSSVVDQTFGDIIYDVIGSFDSVKKYSEENDWENYGKAMAELEYNIGNLRSAAENEINIKTNN